MSIYATSLPTWEDNQAEIAKAKEAIRTALISMEGMTVSKHAKGVRITVQKVRNQAEAKPTRSKRRKE